MARHPINRGQGAALQTGIELALRRRQEADAVAEAYGAWREKSMYGKKYMGIERSTFLIDEEGVIRRAWRKVIPRGHAAEVAAALSD